MEWATSLKHKIRQDIYLSTRIKIALCLIFFVGLIIVSYWILIGYLEEVTTTSILEYLVQVVSTGENDPRFFEKTNEHIDAAFQFMALLLVMLGVLCSIVVSRLALGPVSQALNLQKRFISGIAHELRTPLSILRMNNEIASFEADPSSSVGALLKENMQDIDMINEMLNNLLLLERVTSAESIRFEQIDLLTVIHDARDRLTALATQKRIAVVSDLAGLPMITGSKTALEQVFFNILKNAISYTPEGGSVEIVYLGSSEKELKIRISDNGVGIPEKDVPHIFEPFYRSEKTGKLSGTGIGLAIVAEILKLHRGSITVSSTIGKGTSFFITLPLKASPLRKSGSPHLRIFNEAPTE